MAPVMQFSASERRREKELSRQQDELRIARGEASPEQIRDRNGLFSALDHSQARLIVRRGRVRL